MAPFKKGQIQVESFETSDKAWRALTKKYAELLNTPRYKDAKAAGYTLGVIKSKGLYWVVVNPPR